MHEAGIPLVESRLFEYIKIELYRPLEPLHNSFVLKIIFAGAAICADGAFVELLEGAVF